MVSLALLLKPSTIPEDKPLDSNQLSSRDSCFRSVFANFFMGSIFERFARTHHSRRNLPAHVPDVPLLLKLRARTD